MYKYQNYEKLSKYFNALAQKGKEMPNMPTINKSTGVSTSTISRYAIKRGYYSFPAMRANFNKSLSNEVFDDYGLLKLITSLEKKSFVVVTSLSTRIVGLHLYNRLKQLGFDVRSINHSLGRTNAIKSIEEKEVVFFISLTGESNWHSEITKLKNKKIILSANKVSKRNSGEYIMINRFVPKSTSYFDKNKAIIKMLNWVDDAMNVLTIEGKSK